MIYLKNNTETQAIYIPRQTVLGGGYIPSTKAYEKGYRDGLEDGKEQQKDKLSSLHVAENGQYEREDGWNVVTVDVPDLNGSYNEGYEQGKTDGIDEQKGKLESISITENGVYSKEDGYNHIEVNVPSYEEGQADMAAKARVLNVTENGTYLSKFSDPIPIGTITGVYNDGTEFNNYAELNGKIFNTKIAGSVDSRLEFWYKGDNQKSGDAYNLIIGSGNRNDSNCFQVRYYSSSNNALWVEIGNSRAQVNPWNDIVWHHLIVSKAEGLWIDGKKINGFSPTNTVDGEFFINGIGYDAGGVRTANGTFGMIKIDDVVIIPTADGFLNTNTGELLEVARDGSYTFTEGQVKYGEGELYKTINVNVPDLNGSYEEGKTDGINEQKSKLESINITKNGTYNREDGYNKIIVKVPDLNGSYDEGYTDGEQAGYNSGYDQGQADMAANARVLNVTENGVYKSKFSDPIIPANYTVTGVYADGTNFYSYAELNGKVFNTKIAGSVNSRLEFWYKGDNTSASDGWNAIIGSGNNDNRNCFQVRYWDNNNGRLLIEIGNSGVNYYNWDDTVWHHLIISKAEGLWIDGKKEWNFKQPTNTVNGEFLINGVGYNVNSNANGYFGMIKIDNVVIIPTADGFLNTNTGELLEVVKDGTYNFTENLPIYGEGELYKTINVNVPSVQDEALQYDTIAFSYTVYNWSNHNINRDNMTTNCGDRPLDCLLFRNRLGECTVMTKLDNCSGTAQLENGWTEDNIIRTLKSKTITKFLSNSINSNQLTSIDTGLAQLKENAIINCNTLTDIKLAILNNNLSVQFASNCFNGLPAEGTITIGKTADVTLTDDEITSFFRTIVGEGWTITIK